MSVLRILLLSGIVSISLAGKINNLQIINEENVTPTEMPFIVSLQFGKSHMHECGGVIYNKNYVVSAAYCVRNSNAENLQIVAGTTNTNYPQIVRKVVDIYVHADFEPWNSYKNDISLLKVDTPFEFTKTLAPFTLPDPKNVYDDKIGVVAGWGRFDIWNVRPDLKKAHIPILSQKKCIDDYKEQYRIYEGQICAHDKSDKHRACYGDIGGPLMVDGAVVGLASWAPDECDSFKYPTVYTRVSEYLDWIAEHAK